MAITIDTYAMRSDLSGASYRYYWYCRDCRAKVGPFTSSAKADEHAATHRCPGDEGQRVTGNLVADHPVEMPRDDEDVSVTMPRRELRQLARLLDGRLDPASADHPYRTKRLFTQRAAEALGEGLYHDRRWAGRWNSTRNSYRGDR